MPDLVRHRQITVSDPVRMWDDGNAAEGRARTDGPDELSVTALLVRSLGEFKTARSLEGL